MKQLIRLNVLFLTCVALALTASAGSESTYSGKEMRQAAPPPECNWTGFYLGLNVGGQFGRSENKDLDGFWFQDLSWKYDESGVVGGGQIGYNYQWNWLVLGLEGDFGYMNLDGSGIEPGTTGTNAPPGPLTAKTESDFYTTLRGRVGVAFNRWLFYGTGGAIGVNYETSISQPANQFSGDKQDFNWGYTVGGGTEYMFNCHWSARVEYLYFNLDDQRFTINNPAGSFPARFDGSTDGHIFRAGLNYKF